MVWVPNAKPIRLDKQQLIIYFLNPNTAHIDTANGADNWNSIPGMTLGIWLAPHKAIMAD